jgi:ParB family chromosome partitioning protein
MSTGKNKFGFDPIEPAGRSSKRERSVGPMGAAVREAAASLQETTEAKIEQRRKNAEDAKAWRAAEAQGRVLVSLPLSDVSTDDLPRDRLDLASVANSDEMEELKASIRARGQKEPIEVYRDGQGRYQLKKGWRRLTALSQLLSETEDDAFARIIARVEPQGNAPTDRVARYIDMVEENVVREDLTFAEMAQVAILAARDPDVEGDDPDAMVGRLYGSLHKMKRSYIRSFVFLLIELDEALKWPKNISRNLGVDLVRLMKAQPDRSSGLRRALIGCASPEEQAEALNAFLQAGQKPKPQTGGKPRERKEKYEFHVGDTKVTARSGECRIVSHRDFTDMPRDRLEQAVRAFEAALETPGNPRVTKL